MNSIASSVINANIIVLSVVAPKKINYQTQEFEAMNDIAQCKVRPGLVPQFFWRDLKK
jgi:hypothetical protein